MLEFIDYDKFNERISQLLENKNLIKHKPIAYSPCGFPVEHYSIGNGKKHITIMGGTHGTEIISIDFVTILMKNVLEGKMFNFDKNIFTLDFIPCQNPESFIIVTDSLKPYIKENFEEQAKQYYENFKRDDQSVIAINNFFRKIDNKNHEQLINKFWDDYRFSDVSKKLFSAFCIKNINTSKETLAKDLDLFYKGISINNDIIYYHDKFHHQMFKNINYENLLENDEKHLKLKFKIKLIMEKNYNNYHFPKQSLIDFRANSNGVDLNKNNKYNLLFKNKEKNKLKKLLFGNIRYNTLLREVPGPQGKTCDNVNNFTYESENLGLIKHLLQLRKEKKYAGLFSYHAAGGVIYSKSLNPQLIKNKKLVQIDNFNNKLAIPYSQLTDYKIMDYIKEIIGTGDTLRALLPGVLIIELSKMGGNPIGPYGDKEAYKKTINDNLKAFNQMLKITKSLNYNDEYTKEM